MKVDYVGGCPYEDNPGEVLNLTVILDEGEVIRLGDTVDILMMDDTYLQREVKMINPRYAGDYAAVSKKMRAEVDAGECGESKKKTTIVTGPCRCTLVVMNVPYHEVKTDDEITARRLQEEQDRMIDLTPYREFTGGRNSDSITEHTQEGYTVPDKVLTYLQVGDAYMMCPGIYDHPFKPDTQLLGPYYYTDGIHYWDRDTWKYVLKYHVVLPECFIKHVMSDAGTAFIEKRLAEEDAWSASIKNWKQREGMLCLLPDNAGSTPVEDF